MALVFCTVDQKVKYRRNTQAVEAIENDKYWDISSQK